MEIRLKAEFRRKNGKGMLNRLRQEGKIPAIYYGKKLKAIPIAVDAREFREAMKTEAGSNVLINLDIDTELISQEFGVNLKGKQVAIVKEVQRHPVRGDILHVDFQKVSMAEEIQATVPVVLVGEPAGVKAGGVLQHAIREVTVKCLPKNLPDHIEVNVSHMEIGDNIHVSDLPSIEGVEVLNDPEEILVSITPPTKVEVPVAAAEEEEEAVAEPEAAAEEEKAKAEEKEPEGKEKTEEGEKPKG